MTLKLPILFATTQSLAPRESSFQNNDKGGLFSVARNTKGNVVSLSPRERLLGTGYAFRPLSLSP